MENKHIFLCYASEDRPKVRELHDRLTKDGFSTWYDEKDLLPGMTWKTVIETAIPQSSAVLIFLSKRSINKSGFIQKEIKLALEIAREYPNDRIFIIPIRLDECDLPQTLSHLQSVYLYDVYGYNKLLQALTNFTETSQIITNNKSKGGTIYDKNLNKIINILISQYSSNGIQNEHIDTIKSLVIDPFFDNLLSSMSGKIPLSPQEYYKAINTDISNACKNWDIYAVSKMPSFLWKENVNQKKYAKLNEIAKSRGAEIKRLFVAQDNMQKEYIEILMEHRRVNIDAKVSDLKNPLFFEQLEDMVIFKAPGIQKAYIGISALDSDSEQINSGYLIIDKQQSDVLIENFTKAWAASLSIENYLLQVGLESINIYSAPGLEMKKNILLEPVESCIDAAKARRVPLKNELKTLIIETSYGIIAAHLRGDEQLSLRKVKKHLQSAEAYLASPEALESMSLTTGTVCAILEPVWSLRHIYSYKLFELKYLTTNDGSKTGYFKFEPRVLIKAKQFSIGDITT